MLHFNKKLGFALTVLIGSIGLGLSSILLIQRLPLLSPLTEQPIFSFLATSADQGSDKVVYGFLPYWNLKQTTLHPELSHLAYFSVTVLGDGTVLTKTTDGPEPGYRQLSSDLLLDLIDQANQRQIEFQLVLSMFNNDDIAALLSSPTAQTKLLETLDSMVLAYPISGVNIDIEYTGSVSPELRTGLTTLIAKLNQHLDQTYDSIELSIDMYSSAASHEYLWDVEQLALQVDYIIIMAYDFHRSSSTVAGPVAPLFGGNSHWDSDINQHLKDFTQLVPSHKLLLGIPFYGYEWETVSDAAQAHTIPNTGQTAQYRRVQSLLNQATEFQVTEHWNDTALSPYLTFVEAGETHVLYYDNSRSLSYKLDFVNQLNLGGIAIWALGYEGDYPELWEVISRKLSARSKI